MQIFIPFSITSSSFRFLVLAGLRIGFVLNIFWATLSFFFFSASHFLWMYFQHVFFCFLMEKRGITHPIISSGYFIHLSFGFSRGDSALISLLLLYLSEKPFILYLIVFYILHFIFCLYFLDCFHVFFKSSMLFLQG